ncbi:unnamed protein product [Adineta ricciae]|uniref:G-protein coupled receptors family 1 profile domain-containing protein n=1 Tax=Adineta ricciae TaxID=249248 RepID=A0A814P634_ADIRI|nr:unnamed protein product [Adineta ricciae]
MDIPANWSGVFQSGYHKCTSTNEIFFRYLGTLIFFIGIISTFLSIAVFTRKPLRRKSCCFYFLILAISDSIHLTTMTIEHLPYAFQVDLVIIHSVICKLIIFLIYFSNHLSNIILTLASIDRFLLIYYPSRSRNFCNIQKAKWFTTIVIIVVFFSSGHILYGYERVLVFKQDAFELYDCTIPSNNALYSQFFLFYDSYIESICFVSIPFIVMSICSVLIIYQILISRRNVRSNSRIKQSRLRDKDVQLSCMLIGTSFAFLFLCLPAEINDTFNYLIYEHSCPYWLRKVVLISLQQIYYAGHFYIYTLTGQIFRRHLYAFLFLRRRSSALSKQDFPTEHRPSVNIDTNRLRTSEIEMSSRPFLDDSSSRSRSDCRLIIQL